MVGLGGWHQGVHHVFSSGGSSRMWTWVVPGQSPMPYPALVARMIVSSYCLARLTSSLVWGISIAWFLFCFCNFSMVCFKRDVSGHTGGSFGSSLVGVS